jgi:hypothetical protein
MKQFVCADQQAVRSRQPDQRTRRSVNYSSLILRASRRATVSSKTAIADCEGSNDTVTLSILDTIDHPIPDTRYRYPSGIMSFRQSRPMLCAHGGLMMDDWIPSFACFVDISRRVNSTLKTPAANGCITVPLSLHSSPVHMSDRRNQNYAKYVI